MATPSENNFLNHQHILNRLAAETDEQSPSFTVDELRQIVKEQIFALQAAETKTSRLENRLHAIENSHQDRADDGVERSNLSRVKRQTWLKSVVLLRKEWEKVLRNATDRRSWSAFKATMEELLGQGGRGSDGEPLGRLEEEFDSTVESMQDEIDHLLQRKPLSTGPWLHDDCEERCAGLKEELEDTEKKLGEAIRRAEGFQRKAKNAIDTASGFQPQNETASRLGTEYQESGLTDDEVGVLLDLIVMNLRNGGTVSEFLRKHCGKEGGRAAAENSGGGGTGGDGQNADGTQHGSELRALKVAIAAAHQRQKEGTEEGAEKIADLEAQIADLEVTRHNLGQNIDALEEALEESEGRLAARHDREDSLNDQIRELSKELDQVKASEETRRKDQIRLDDLLFQAIAKEVECRNAKESLNQKIRTLQDQTQQAESAPGPGSKDNDLLAGEDDAAADAADAEDAEDETDEEEYMAAELEAQIRVLENQVEQLVGRVRLQQAEIDALDKGGNEGLTAQIEVLNTRIEELEEKLRKCKNETWKERRTRVNREAQESRAAVKRKREKRIDPALQQQRDWFRQGWNGDRFVPREARTRYAQAVAEEAAEAAGSTDGEGSAVETAGSKKKKPAAKLRPAAKKSAAKKSAAKKPAAKKAAAKKPQNKRKKDDGDDSDGNDGNSGDDDAAAAKAPAKKRARQS